LNNVCLVEIGAYKKNDFTTKAQSHKERTKTIKFNYTATIINRRDADLAEPLRHLHENSEEP